MRFHNASAPPPASTGRGSASDPLAQMRRDQAARDLDEVIGRIDDLGARLARQESEEPLDPKTIALLEEITGAEDASLAFRSLRRRVHEGILTWADFWADPLAQPEGMVLFHAVMRAELDRGAALAAEEPPG